MEIALVLPILFLLLFAMLDFGRVVYTQHTINQAAREATRVGIVQPSTAGTKLDAIRAAAVTSAPGTGLSTADVFGSSTLRCGTAAGTPAQSGSDFYPEGTDTGDCVVVSVRAQVSLVTPVLAQLVGGSYTVTALSVRYLP